MEYPCHSESEKRWFLMSVVPMSGKEGGVVISHTNISERKQAELRLKESEKKFRNLFEQSPLSIQITNPDGKIIQVNPAYSKLWGISESTLAELYERYNVFQDKHIKELGFMAFIEKAYNKGEVVHLPSVQYDPIEMMKAYGFDKPSGQKRWIQCSIYPTKDEDGQLLNVIHIEEDITERKKAEDLLKQSEEQRRQLIEQTPLAIEIHSVDGKFLLSNPAYSRLTGLHGDELQAVKESFDVRQDEQFHRLGFGPLLERLYAGETIEFPVYGYNVSEEASGLGIEVADTGTLWVRTIGFPLKSSTGRTEAVVLMSEDFTAQKVAEEAVRRYQQRLKTLSVQLTIAEERERRRIAADLHDHVGHSLALARMQLDGLQDSPTELERNIIVKDISNIMLQALQETRSLIFELSSPLMNEIGLGAAIAEWLEEQVEKRYGIKTQFSDTIAEEHRKTLDENVRALLFRNVRELLTNVIKHSRATTVSVRLQESGSETQILIEDDGVGFDHDVLKNQSRSTNGFGLFSVQERMADLGGRCDILSAPGKGCRAILAVPLEKSDGVVE
jgi:PAS domain S-box-containing protein